MSLASVLAQLSTGKGLPQRFKPFANQAANEAYLRFAPEWEGLNQLRQQSAQTLRQNVGQANSAAQLIAALSNEGVRNINANTNPVIQRMTQYQGTQGSTGLVGQGLAFGQKGVADILSQGALNAPLRAAQQGQQALTSHQADLDKINAQRASLAGQVGAFTQGRLGDLVNADRKDRATLNQNLRQIKTQLATSGVDSSGHVVQGGPKDPAIAHPPKTPSTIAKPPSNYPGSEADWNNASRADRNKFIREHPTGAQKGPGGIKPATPGQHGSLKDRISYGIGIAKTHKAQGDQRGLTAQILTQGVPAFTAPGGGKIPAVKALPQLSASIALDIAYDGHVSRKNVVELHKRGYSLAQLGFPTKAQPKVRLPLGGSIPLPSS